MKTKTQLLIDGNNLAFTSHYAHMRLSAYGRPTGAIYGAVQTVKRLKKRVSPYKIIVCWDSRVNYRKHLVPTYKANRSTSPGDRKKIVYQFPKIREIFSTLGIASATSKGLEADDIIAILSKSRKTVIASTDTDMYQLLSKRVSILHLASSDLYTEEDFRRDYKISPPDWVTVIAIAGKKSNNMNGVEGVGIKTALQFVAGGKISKNRLEAIMRNGVEVRRGATLAKLPLLKATPKIEEAYLDIAKFRALCTSYKFSSILKGFKSYEELFFG